MNTKSAGVRETMRRDGDDGEWEQADLTNRHRWHEPGAQLPWWDRGPAPSIPPIFQKKPDVQICM